MADAVINHLRDDFGVEPVCRELGPSASAYNARRRRPKSAQRLLDEQLLAKIRSLNAVAGHHFAFRSCTGQRRPRRLLGQAPSAWGERAGGHDFLRRGAVAVDGPARACHDLAAARTHRVIRICERQGVPILADRAYIGAGAWVTTPAGRPAGGELPLAQQAANRALSRARAPVEVELPAGSPGGIPTSTGQPEPNDVNPRSRLHPEEAAMLKDLTRCDIDRHCPAVGAHGGPVRRR